MLRIREEEISDGNDIPELEQSSRTRSTQTKLISCCDILRLTADLKITGITAGHGERVIRSTSGVETEIESID